MHLFRRSWIYPDPLSGNPKSSEVAFQLTPISSTRTAPVEVLIIKNVNAISFLVFHQAETKQNKATAMMHSDLRDRTR
ncbi:MAG: hypothetical protein QOH32_1036 [Bradyrhizobium sp.]|nr:hypothetical protein [Bradyrhizobium sp.]